MIQICNLNACQVKMLQIWHTSSWKCQEKTNYYVAITCLQSFNVYNKFAGGEPVSCYNLSPILSSVHEYINTKPRWFSNQLQTHKIFMAMMIRPAKTTEVGSNCRGALPVQSASEWSRAFPDPLLGRDLWCHQMLSSCK